MSFEAYLKVAGKEYPVEAVTYSFDRGFASAADSKPEPSTAVRCSGISITLQLGDDDKIIEWMADSYKKLDGSIVYKKHDEDSTLKEMKFKQAYCISYAEAFSANSSSVTIATISIMPQEVSIGEAEWATDQAVAQN